MLYDYTATKPSENYKLMSQTIIPRPIAWIVTEDDGVVNIAPFSYFTPLSSSPPTLIVSIGHKSDGTPKDTLFNIRKTEKCTICMVDPESLSLMDRTSAELPKGVSEAEKYGIELKEIEEGFPPAVAGTPSALFCRFYKEVDLPDSRTVPIILEIVKQFVDDRYIVDEAGLKISFEPIGRVGRSYILPGNRVYPD
ncbi:MAG: flavin reductase family protein [Hydrogenimonas sp.]|nr:flavin reductase family protein [Hydrogenimonas sp.]